MGRLDQWQHCPRCAAAINVEHGKVECVECGFVEYAGSKPTASAVCVDDEGRLLLSRRGVDPAKGMWDFPGGFLDEEEHPLDCIRRELNEEAGVEVEPLEFVGVWIDRYGDDGDAHVTLNLYWTARIVEGEPEPADDVAEFRWFAPTEIPDDELAFPHTRELISAWRDENP